MIVIGMNEEELKRDLELDLFDVDSRAVKACIQLRRTVIKAKTLPVKTCVIYKSPRKNKWIICIHASSKKMISKTSLVAYGVLQNTDQGIYFTTVMMIKDKIKRFHFYTPHFFSRYAERCKINKNGEDLIIHFLLNNGTLSYFVNESDKDNVTIEGSCQDGVALGSVTEHDNYLLRTFITRNQAIGRQIAEFKELEKIRLDIDKAHKPNTP